MADCTAAPAGQDGWASAAGATYGGAYGPTVTVTTLAELQAEANKKVTAETILVDGLFTGSGMITVRDNKSIIVGPNSGLIGLKQAGAGRFLPTPDGRAIEPAAAPGERQILTEPSACAPRRCRALRS